MAFIKTQNPRSRKQALRSIGSALIESRAGICDKAARR
jgi:hypothetical protein